MSESTPPSPDSGAGALIARSLRWLLAIATVAAVAWSFGEVGARIWRNYRAESKGITLTILHWGNAAEDQIVQHLCDRYCAEHPNVRIVRINRIDPGNMSAALKTMLAAGTPPDLFYLQPSDLPQMAELKLIRPVDDYVDRDLKAGKADWFKDFYPILLKAWRYDAARERVGEGPMYGLPKDFTTSVFYVNVDLFNKAGVPVPYGGWTWDQFEADMKKITALSDRPEYKDEPIYGGFLQIWPDSLRNIIWTYGGDYFGPGGFRDVTLDKPPAQDAMDMIVRMRLHEKTVYNPTGIAKDGGQEFINGHIGCIGPIGRWMVPTYKDITSFRWDCVPVPYKTKHASMMYLTAWSMSAATPHPDECYELMKFLCGQEGAAMQARAGLAIPPLQSVANSPDFLSPPGLPPHNAKAFLDAIPFTPLQQVPKQPEWNQILTDDVARSLQMGKVTPMVTAQQVRDDWLQQLDSPLEKGNWGPMRWNVIVSATAAIFVTIVTLLWWRARREKLGALDKVQERAGWTFIAPWLIGFLALTLGPMIVSLLLSFTKWTGMQTLGHAQCVGVANYAQLLSAARPTFVQSLRVTAYFVILGVPVTQIAALAVALLMNSRVRGIEVFRTIYFVPSVVGSVTLAVLWLQIFNNDYGILNHILRPFAHLLGTTPPDWFGTDAKVWAIPAFVIMGLWGVGSGMILYLAGLKGIPSSLYEAAIVDGAGPLRKFWNVTLPMLSPLIFYNLVMGIIGSFQVFTQAYVMTGGGPDNDTLFYVLHLYRQAFEFHNMGFASALAWVLFVIVLLLTVLVFRGSKDLVYYEGLKA